jgi:hypothetical protein
MPMSSATIKTMFGGRRSPTDCACAEVMPVQRHNEATSSFGIAIGVLKARIPTRFGSLLLQGIGRLWPAFWYFANSD